MQYTCLNWSELAKTLASIEAKQTIALLDCCHAGAFGIERTQPQDSISYDSRLKSLRAILTSGC